MDKFNNFLPDKYKLFTFSDQYRLIFYISEKELEKNNITYDCLAWIETIWLEEDNEMSISWITTNNGYKGNGLGTMLIIAATTYHYKVNNIKQIILDDFSNNAFLSNNIYTSLGLKYIEAEQPEMIGKSSVIIKKWGSFINKYKNKKFYN